MPKNLFFKEKGQTHFCSSSGHAYHVESGEGGGEESGKILSFRQLQPKLKLLDTDFYIKLVKSILRAIFNHVFKFFSFCSKGSKYKSSGFSIP